MSAKGRKRKDGEQKEKPASEFYPTPAWCTARLLQHVPLPNGQWLEPSAGDGAIIRAAQAVRPEVEWTAYEIRPEPLPQLQALVAPHGRAFCRDFLSGPHFTGFDACLMNPPFSLAARFIDHALGGASVVVALLRLNFLGSSTDRRSLFERRGMPDVYVLPERPSFTGEGTDATEYGWFLWRADRSQRGEVRILWDKAQSDLFAKAV